MQTNDQATAVLVDELAADRLNTKFSCIEGQPLFVHIKLASFCKSVSRPKVYSPSSRSRRLHSRAVSLIAPVEVAQELWQITLLQPDNLPATGRISEIAVIAGRDYPAFKNPLSFKPRCQAFWLP